MLIVKQFPAIAFNCCLNFFFYWENSCLELGMTFLNYFILSLCRIFINEIFFAGLEYLSRCSKLRSLKLGLCMNISDKGLCLIASNCKNIYELDLYKCCGIGDEGLAALSSSCKRLKILNISYCARVTDKGMKHMSQLEELSDLDMRGLVRVTSVGLTALAAGCKRLADLDMKHCESVNDSGFWALAYYSRNLRQVFNSSTIGFICTPEWEEMHLLLLRSDHRLS